ncbi:hypothetical protein KA005_04875, partial [bacterium]|nr:hypothetical protein [bacterium]
MIRTDASARPIRHIFYTFLGAIGKFREKIPERPLVLNPKTQERSQIEITNWLLKQHRIDTYQMSAKSGNFFWLVRN